MNNFSLTYSPFSASPSVGQLLNHVKINRFIQQYYQPYPGTYLLKSSESAFVLNESLRGFFEQAPYMLIQFDAQLTSGQLPPEIWNWINFGMVPVAPALPPPAPWESLTDALRRYNPPPPPPAPPKS